MTKKRSSINTLIFILLVLIPTTAAGIYYFKYASDQYVSESKFIVQSNNHKSSDSLGMFSGLTGLASASKDSMAVHDYILSSDILAKLLDNVDLKKHYTNNNIDILARLDQNSSREELLTHWENLTKISFDTTSGISTLEVTAFDPKTALKISNAILTESEIFANNISKKAREDAVELAFLELQMAENEINKVREKIYSFKSSERIVSPEQRASAEEGLISELKQKLSATETELTRLKSFMQNDSLKVKATEAERLSLKTQIERHQQRWEVTNPSTGKSITTLIQDTGQFSTELALAEKIYESAIVGLRQAKRENNQQQRYLEIIVNSQLPDEAIKPQRLRETITIFLASLMIWGIFSLLIASVKDHIGWV